MAESLSNVAPLPLRMHVQVDVTDPEVIAEIRSRSEGDRPAYILGALRVGVLAMRAATGQLDAGSIREAGAKLLGDLRELLTARGAEMSAAVKTELTKHFDPKTGTLPQRLDRLVGKNGEIERCLATQIAPENSVLAQALSQKLGEGSPIFRMLSPDDARGLKAQLETAIRTALDRQQQALLQEFSLDSADSALSRLVGRVEVVQRTVADQFSMDNEDSALRRMTDLLDETNAQIQRNLTLDDEDSALARLGREMQAKIDDIIKVNTQVLEAVVSLQSKKQANACTTGHGLPFEEKLGQFLTRQALAAGDIHDSVGTEKGALGSKVGDFLTVMGPDSAAAGARIVWEAKANRAYDVKKALAELETARKNRGAQVGVFVFSMDSAPDDLPGLTRYGSDLIIVWDEEDPVSDVYLEAAWSLARALLVREASNDNAADEVGEEVTAAVRDIERQLPHLDEIRRLAQTVANNGGKIVDRAAKMAAEIGERLKDLEERVLAPAKEG